ncbi:MAG: tryptophan synthase subunit alpha [Atopobiaceae bacterium]|nr:tryptophan synthase subunit alpha [Atopobiaceae bacterium]
MSRTIRDAFAQSPNGKAFVAFITAGDPSLDVTEELVLAMAEEGVDLIELGIPFSDPTAEGPVIQEANLRALSGGVTTDDVFDMVERVRAHGCDVPLVFMTYANVVFSYGVERFAEREARTGMQGIILPDVPFEEKDEFAAPFAEQGLELVSLIAPTSAERISTIARDAAGFVYCVSSLGVTGVRSEITTDIGAMVELVRAANPDVPVAVGFGISTPEQAARMAALSDGAIVGSAIIKLVAQHGEACAEPVRAYVREMAAAVHAV